MSHRSYYVHPQPSREPATMNPWIIRLMLLGATGVVLLFFTLVALLAGYEFMTQNEIYPGVSPIFGVDIGGMTQQEAIAALSSQFDYAQDATFTFSYQDQTWTYTAQELGVAFDVEATVADAYAVGRDEGGMRNLVTQWRVWREGRAVAPVIRYNQSDAQSRLNTIAETYVNRPVMDATLVLVGGAVEHSEGQSGLRVDVSQTLELLQNEILNLSQHSTIPLQVQESQPAIASAAAAAARLEQALHPSGVTFYIPNETGKAGGPWTASPDAIENMVRIDRVEHADGTADYEVYVALDQPREFLSTLTAELSQEPQNARFIFNDDSRQLEVIQPSQKGLRLDIEATVAQFSDAVFSATDRTVPLIFSEVEADISDNATAGELGITELISEATTYYVGSTSARRANIQVAAARYHGIVIKPGQEFSFNEYLGDVSVEEGFEQALIIVGNQTITGVGGGVCQVTTTVFQAAFYAGYPILERYPHAYRVGYYETGEGAGMDATVYSPIVDFRFLNDTPHHLLIESYVNPGSSTVTFKFYSTSMGRRVVKEGPVIRNQQAPPPPIYRANPALSAGQVQQVDYAVGGAEVYVYRTVYQGDEVIIDNELFYSNYIPWAAQFEVAPGDSRIN